MYIDNLLFAIILIAGIGFFAKNVIKLKRFTSSDLKGKPKNDADIILYFEVVLSF